MGSLVLTERWCLLTCMLSFICVVKAGVTVEGFVDFHRVRDPISTTDENFVCATLDWWPPDHCNSGSCSWGNASLLNLDLTNNILLNAVKAFSPLRIRLGGTLQDRVVYRNTGHKIACVPFVQNSSEVRGYTEGCFPLSRWDELNSFVKKTGAVITFGINALLGKIIQPNNTATGPWNPNNAASLFRYTVKKGYKVYGWELGNELGGRAIDVSVSPGPYVSDTNTLEGLIQKTYKNMIRKPLILAPGGIFEQAEEWFRQYINNSRSVDVITHHIYNLGLGTDEQLIQRILDPSYLDKITYVFKNLQIIIRDAKSSAVPWVSEAGGIPRSGRYGVSNTFVNSFWYLDQLGMSSIYGTKVYCRQTLIGGNYGLLNTTTFVPNPDYYSALLWHRLMGRYVLSTKFIGTRMIRAYAHCAKNSAGVTLLLMNLDGNTTVEARLNLGEIGLGLGRGLAREEYHLTPKDGNIQSQTVLLNGKELSVDPSRPIRHILEPVTIIKMDPITVAPYSIVFAHIPRARVRACWRKYNVI